MRTAELSTVAAIALLAGCAEPVDVEGRGAELAPPRLLDFSVDQGTEEPVPACASALFRSIHEAARRHVGGGTVPAARLSTYRNVAVTPPWIGGESIFPAIAGLVEQARYEVNLQTYSWKSDSDPAREMLAAIERLEDNRRREPTGQGPVIVRILVDTMLAAAFEMVELSAAVEALQLDAEIVRVEIGAWRHSSVDSLHSKSIIVDGEAAIVTGVNFSHWNDYITGEHDAAFHLEGEVVLSLLADFDDAWRRSMPWVWRCPSWTTSTTRRTARSSPRSPARSGYASRHQTSTPEPRGEVFWPP